MKRIMQVEIKTAAEWGTGPGPDLWAEIVNPRTGEVLDFFKVDERWLAE